MPEVRVVAAWLRVFSRPAAHDRLGNIALRVHLPEALGRVIGTVRPRERDLEEKRLFAFVIRQKIHRGVAGPGGGVEVLRQHIGPGVVFVEPQSGGMPIQRGRLRIKPRHVVAAKIDGFDPARLVEDGLVKAVQAALRRPVHFPNAQRVVAGIPHFLREFAGVFPAHSAIRQHPVVPGRQAREQPRPRGRAARRRGVCLREQRSFPREAIEVGRTDGGVAIGPDAIGPVLVCHDEEDIRLARRRLRCARIRRGRPGRGAGRAELEGFTPADGPSSVHRGTFLSGGVCPTASDL